MKKYKYKIDLPKGFIVNIEGLPFELLGAVKVGSNTLPQVLKDINIGYVLLEK